MTRILAYLRRLFSKPKWNTWEEPGMDYDYEDWNKP
jgi:hypothetical protein